MYNIFTVSKLYILSNKFLLTFNWRNNDILMLTIFIQTWGTVQAYKEQLCNSKALIHFE